MSTLRAALGVDVWIAHVRGKTMALLRYRSFEQSGVERLTSTERLTPAERAVARLAARGMAARDIAAARSTSQRTVSNQLAAIYRKFGVASRAELTALLLAVTRDVEE